MELKEVEPGLTADEPRYKDLFLADADGSNLRYLGPFVTHPSWHPSESRFFFIPITAERICTRPGARTAEACLSTTHIRVVRRFTGSISNGKSLAGRKGAHPGQPRSFQ